MRGPGADPWALLEELRNVIAIEGMSLVRAQRQQREARSAYAARVYRVHQRESMRDLRTAVEAYERAAAVYDAGYEQASAEEAREQAPKVAR